MRIRTVALLAPLATVVALTGCSKTIDDSKAEKEIKTVVEKQVGSKVKSVSCPGGKTAKKGDTFTCTVTGADGSTGKVLITEKDDKGNVNISAPFVHTAPDAAAIVKDLEAKNSGLTVKVVCPDIVEGKKGTTFDCTADGNQGKATITVTLSDAQGSFDYKVKNSSGG